MLESMKGMKDKDIKNKIKKRKNRIRERNRLKSNL